MARAELAKEVRRKQLIDATMRAIGRYGYANMTLTHVAGAAGLSPGICNFYFKSKEQLLVATLEQIAEEYQTFWQAAIAKGRLAPASGLAAMIEADFHPAICNVEKISIWYAFWAEARTNPAYHEVVHRLETDYLQQTEALCARIVAEGGYAGIEARAAALGLNAMIDGLWFDCLIEPKSFNRAEAKRACRLFLAGLFPAHFTGAAKVSRGEPVALATERDESGREAHLARLAAALRRRLEPIGSLKREALAAAVGVPARMLDSWLEARAEPSSFQIGRLIAAADPALWLEVYGPVHAEMQRLYEARLAESEARARRDRAALAALAGES